MKYCPDNVTLNYSSPIFRISMAAVSFEDTSIHHRTNSDSHSYVNTSAGAVEVVERHLSDIGASNRVSYSPFKMRKAKRIRFLCNGDRFDKGVMMAVAPERYRSFDSLLSELTRAFSGNINLPSGVRTVFTMDGAKVAHLDDLEDGKEYVCSSNAEQFKKVDYGSSCLPTRVKPARSLTKLHSYNSNQNSSPNSIIHRSMNTVRPRIIILIRNGTRPRRVLRLLLNKRNAPSFEHALSTITDAVKLDTGAVRKVFNSKRNQVCLHQTDLFFYVRIFSSIRFSLMGNKGCKKCETFYSRTFLC